MERIKAPAEISVACMLTVKQRTIAHVHDTRSHVRESIARSSRPSDCPLRMAALKRSH